MEAFDDDDYPFPTFSVIAMKGHPFTRKTELGNAIAFSLECPIISLEHVLCLLTPQLSQEQENKAFKVICDIAFHNLYEGSSHSVVIDSPLSSESHLIQLTNAASKFKPLQVRLIIIECKPTNNYSWKLKLEEHLGNCPPKPEEWYKPKSWEDVEKSIKHNLDYDETSLEGHEFVSKLVLDPLLDVPVGSSLRVPSLVEAVKYMMTRRKGEGLNVVVYNKWLRKSQNKPPYSSSSSPPQDEKQCSKHGHDIVPNFMAMEGLQPREDCMSCKKKINHNVEAYCYCKNCSLALHMECAGAFNHNIKTRERHLLPRMSYSSYPIKFSCKSCMEGGEDFSENCGSCLFQSHLNSRLMPTIIKHFDTEEHFLTILLRPAQSVDGEVYRCIVCGINDTNVMYLCKDCGIAYHYRCATLPRRVKDEHGGHHHNLSLKFESEEAEDYLCLECMELRDPSLWFYSCEDCSGYDLHPSCVDAVKQLTCPSYNSIRNPLFNFGDQLRMVGKKNRL